jgi:four helix bundle protein
MGIAKAKDWSGVIGVRGGNGSRAEWRIISYEKLKGWEASHRLAVAVYEATAEWPRSELYGLTAQTRRAADSAPANIAEGVGRRGGRELRRYGDIALGSLSELTYLLRLAHELGYLPTERLTALEDLRAEAARCLAGLCRRLERQAST